MERGAVGGNAEIAIALAIEHAGTDSAVKEVPHAVGVAVTGELGEQCSTLLNELRPEIGIPAINASIVSRSPSAHAAPARSTPTRGAAPHC